jgi:PAS domain S-box-containing protein
MPDQPVSAHSILSSSTVPGTPPRSHRLFAYATAVLAVAGATGVRLLLDPVLGDRAPLLFNLLAALLAGLQGFGPGLVATLLGAAAGKYFFLEPRGTWLPIHETADVVQLCGYIAAGIVASALIGRLHTRERRARAREMEIEEARQAMAASVARLNTVVDRLDDAFFVTDAEGRCSFANPGVEKLFGKPPDAFLGEVLSGALPAGDPAQVSRTLAQAASTDGSASLEAQDPRSGRWFEYRAHAVAEGGAAVIATDITERREIESTLAESARRYRLFAESLPFIVWQMDATGKSGFANRYTEEFAGLPLEALGNGGWLQMLHPDDAPSVQAAWMTALREGDPVSVEFRARRADGQYRWLRGMGQPVRDAHGRIAGWIGAALDIEDQKHTEDQLRASEEVHRALSDLTSDYAWTARVHPDGRQATEWITSGFTKLLGYTLKELNDHGGWRTIVHPDDLPHAEEAIRRALAGEDVVGELRHVSKSGRVRLLHYLTRPIRDKSGRVVRLCGAVHDVTERKRHEEDLRRARESAERANRLKDEFLATLSHELRTPLNAILGWTRMLRSKPLPPETISHALEVIERNARAQTQLVEDIFDVSRIITGKLRLERRAVELADVIEAALDVVRPAAEAKGIHLQVMLEEQIGPIAGDANRLQQVVWNLLSNAVKFTPRGGEVQVRLQHGDTHADIIVKDTGTGIPASFLPHIFDRFRQAEGGFSGGHGGLGLGLAIVKHVVEAHGGTVEASSAGPDKGTTFLVRLPLPLVGVDPDLGPDAGLAAVEAVTLSSRARGAMLQDLRVLIVDDEADACDLLSQVLHHCGAEVQALDSARGALDQLDSWRPDIMLIDIGLPGMDGWDLIREVRKRSPEAGGEVPAIALTAYARTEDRIRALREGFHLHLAKPVDPDEIVNVIAALAQTPTARH